MLIDESRRVTTPHVVDSSPFPSLSWNPGPQLNLECGEPHFPPPSFVWKRAEQEMAYSVSRTQCYIWEWQRDDGGWSPYPADVIQLLEDQFNKVRSPSFDLQHLPNSVKSRHPRLQENSVDFTAMEQVHKESGETARVSLNLSPSLVRVPQGNPKRLRLNYPVHTKG